MKQKKIKPSINALLKLPSNPLERFHGLTKFKKWGPFPPVDQWPKSWKIVFFKEYPRLDKIFLPNPELDEEISLRDVLYKRQSSRVFSKKKLTLEQISNLLFYSAGMRTNKKPWLGTRFYPSPGGRYSLEVYIISLNSDLPVGIYHYNVRSHVLEILDETILKKNYIFNQDWIHDASLLIIFTTVFARNTIKYGWRGYRHVMQEAGHLGQNFYLIAPALDLSICGIGGYVDDRLNQLIDVDGLKETVIYALAVGNENT